MRKLHIIIVALAIAVTTVGTAIAQSSTSSKLDAKKAGGEIQSAIKSAEDKSAVELMDRLSGWEELLAESKTSRVSLESAVKRNSDTAKEFKKKASTADMPKKAEFYNRKATDLAAASDELSLLLEEHDKNIKALEDRISKVKNEPDVKKLLETENLLGQAKEKLRKANDMLPTK